MEFLEFRESIFESDFIIPLFCGFDSEKLVASVNNLFWNTSYKLFTQVFSENSKYMTVHQAKVLEWDKIVVSVSPGKYDNIDLEDLYSEPKLMDETPSDEFTRMYYVACSRSREDLFIHFSSGFDVSIIQKALNNFEERSGKTINYEFIN